MTQRSITFYTIPCSTHEVEVQRYGERKNLRLNNCLYRRPKSLEDLCRLLGRFRTKQIALTIDIEKFFLDVDLNEAGRNVARFLRVKEIKKLLVDINL